MSRRDEELLNEIRAIIKAKNTIQDLYNSNQNEELRVYLQHDLARTYPMKETDCDFDWYMPSALVYNANNAMLFLDILKKKKEDELFLA